jgi:hypothetical protein
MLRVCRHSTFKNFHVNEAHMLATHGLSRADVEAVCYGDPAQLLVEEAHSGR